MNLVKIKCAGGCGTEWDAHPEFDGCECYCDKCPLPMEPCETCGSDTCDGSCCTCKYCMKRKGLDMNISIDQAKKMIVDFIVGCNGCKITELACQPFFAVDLKDFNQIDLVDKLVKDGELISVNYVLPNLDFREKQFLLPGGTTVSVSGNKFNWSTKE